MRSDQNIEIKWHDLVRDPQRDQLLVVKKGTDGRLVVVNKYLDVTRVLDEYPDHYLQVLGNFNTTNEPASGRPF